ncbi:MAG: IreB family regulatory phosphoprotein [Actinomycetia bacterium]|nr:IreB family regulatory phosphoprotein [Actinomycetes bacterium]
MGEVDETRRLMREQDAANEADAILRAVYQALKDRGYNPISQLTGYLLSGDPAFITSHREARSLIRRLERDELVEELLRQYVQKLEGQPLR